MKPARRLATAPKRAVLYLRQSTFREESISLELQEAAGRAHAAKNGYTVVDVLADPGISGRTWKRPAVQRVMEMLENGEADVVILWRWSRLSRNRRDWALAVDRADLAGGAIESATEPNDATAAGRFARGVMTELAAFESERIGEQWKDAHQRRRNLGLTPDGRPRYGYIKQEDGTYLQDPTTAPLLARMYRAHLGGTGFTGIARELNAEGHRTAVGGDWTRQAVKQVLDSGFGAGQIIHRPGGTARSMRVADSTYYPGAHAAVITPDEWERYRYVRAEMPAAPAVIEPKYMLAGLIFCGDCKHAMHVGHRGVHYLCSGKMQGRGRAGMTMTRELVERSVRLWVGELAADLDRLAAAETETLERKVRVIDSRSVLEARIRSIDESMARLTVRNLEGKIPDAAYDATVRKLDGDRAELLARRDAAEREARTPDHDFRETATYLDQYWIEMTDKEKRDALKRLIRRVEIIKPARQGTGVWRDRVIVTPAWDSAVRES